MHIQSGLNSKRLVTKRSRLRTTYARNGLRHNTTQAQNDPGSKRVQGTKRSKAQNEPRYKTVFNKIIFFDLFLDYIFIFQIFVHYIFLFKMNISYFSAVTLLAYLRQHKCTYSGRKKYSRRKKYNRFGFSKQNFDLKIF